MYFVKNQAGLLHFVFIFMMSNLNHPTDPSSKGWKLYSVNASCYPRGLENLEI